MPRKQKPKKKEVARVVVDASRLAAAPKTPRVPHWQLFFRDQRYPFLRSQLITAMMAGKPLEVDRLPGASLLDAVLLSFAARTYHEAEIVDDYEALCRRTEAAWKEPTWTRRTFDQYHTGTADFIIRGVAQEFICAEDQYIPDMLGSLLASEPPAYFREELTK